MTEEQARDVRVPGVISQRYEPYVPFDQLTPHPANPNEGDSGLVSELISANGFAGAILAQESSGILIDGEHRMRAAQMDGMTGGPVLWLDVDDDTRDRLLASLNESTRAGRNDESRLVALLTGLAQTARGLAGTAYTGEDLDDLIARLNMPPLPDPDDPDGSGGAAAQSLASRFLVPPFSVLDARQGYWQERKRAWLALGIRSEQGRPRNLLKMSDTVLEAGRPNRSQPGGVSHETIKEMRHRDGDRQGETRRRDQPNKSVPPDQHPGTIDEWRRRDGDRRAAAAGRDQRRPNGATPKSASGNDPQYYYKKTLAEREAGRDLSNEEFEDGWYEGPDSYTNGTSVFDPVLAELVYRWFCPKGGLVLDPFAGGSVRGVVAGRLGLDYTGIDLRPEQVLANYEQAVEIGPGRDGCEPTWEPGDARDITAEWPAPGTSFDLILSCPPYFDLEQYGDDIADLSNAPDYPAFLAAYREIIAAACARLADDRFACFVVGEIRDPKGLYRGFVPDTIAAFEAAGLTFYNEAILITSVGSLALRAARIFNGGRKLGKAHQNVLLFCKGDPARAAEACGVLDLPDPAEFFAAEGVQLEDEPEPADLLGAADGELDPADLTPVEEHEGGIWVKRDDAFVRHGSAGGKVRSCLALASRPGVLGLVTASDRESPQVNIVAGVAAALGLPARVHVPAADQPPTPELAEAIAAGAEIIGERPGFNNVIIARAAEDAAARGWVDVPFGMECPEAVEQTAGQAGNVPAGVERVVIAVGSGMSLAGVLAGLEAAGRGDLPVLGVRVGADPAARLDAYAPGWRDRVTLVVPALKYHQRPAVTTFDGISLDPIYEAKCVPYLREGDLFWIIGCRQTARPGYQAATKSAALATDSVAAPVATGNGQAAPGWAKGLPVARLRQVRELWKAHDGDLPLGAFTAVKENQVADWADRGQLQAWATPGGQLVAAAVVTRSKGQVIEDFRGQVIARPQAGDTVVTRFAGNPQVLAAELDQQRLWLWGWMENPADRWLATELGLTWAGTKIRASSELIGLFGPEGTGLDGVDANGLTRMNVDYDPGALWAEVLAAAPAWADHYAVYNKRNTWQAVSLRGYGGRPDFIEKPAEMSRKWKAAHPAELGWKIKDTPLYGPLPQVREVIDSIPGRKHRVRLMRLAPGNGELTRHSDITDPDAGTAPGQLLRLHLPLVTNPQVIFRSWTPAGAVQTAHMAAGECWYLDTRKPHTARNDGPAERVHVVVDVESCPGLLALVLGAALETPPVLNYEPPPAGEWQEWTP